MFFRKKSVFWKAAIFSVFSRKKIRKRETKRNAFALILRAPYPPGGQTFFGAGGSTVETVKRSQTLAPLLQMTACICRDKSCIFLRRDHIPQRDIYNAN